MRKKIFVLMSSSVLCVSAFAQSDSKNPNVEKMQQEFQQASNQAQAQFDKNFPAPRVNSNTTTGSVTSAPAQTTPPPAVPTPPKPQAYTSPAEPEQSVAPAKKVPDVAVNSDNSSSSTPNIYAPGGSTSSQGNNSSYNPYR